MRTSSIKIGAVAGIAAGLAVIGIVLLARRPDTEQQPVTLSSEQPSQADPAGHTRPAGQEPPVAADEDDAPRREDVLPPPKEVPDLRLFGRVVDQQNNAVPGAFVDVEGPHGDHYFLTSDDDGRFGIVGLRGWRLGIRRIDKLGFLEPPRPDLKKRGLKFKDDGPTLGTSEKPIVYRLIKRSPPEPLVSFGRGFEFRPDGTVYTIDLLDGTKARPVAIHEGEQEGDLRVTFRRTPLNPKKRPYTWSATIEAIDGGFAPDDLSETMAPEEGYQARLTWDFKASDPNWVGAVKKQVFFRSRNGQVHGRFSNLTIGSFHFEKDASVEFQGTLNPNHSRNLEAGVDNVLSRYDKKTFDEKKGTLEPESFSRKRQLERLAAKAKPPGVYVIPKSERWVARPKVVKTHDFFGKIVDQEGDPLSGVDVTLAAGPAMYGALPAITYRATTDRNGRFHIRKVRPCHLEVRISKEGYLLGPRKPRGIPFGSAVKKGLGMSAEKPWLWRMWKKQGSAGSYISGSRYTIEVSPDGKPCTVNLLDPSSKDSPAKLGTLRLSLIRASNEQFHNSSEWSFSVEVPSGGLIETKDPFMYEAPKDGYKPQLKWVVKRSNNLRDRSAVRSRKGRLLTEVVKRYFWRTGEEDLFGRLTISVQALHPNPIDSPGPSVASKQPDKGVFSIRYTVNPSGSRNLEPGTGKTYKSLEEFRKNHLE